MTQNEALTILQTGANVFLTGEPGSGKTHTVNAYVAWLRSHGIEPSITASTGIAATHVGGMTIHSWSGIGINERMTPELLDSIASKEHVAKRLQKAKVLIIDEVSMLSGEVLAMVDAVLKEVRHTDLPMGGVQTVLVGDFFQLPPVSRNPTGFAFQSPAWKLLNPLVCYLTEQHRQEDSVFLNVLAAIRSGEWDHTHVSVITSREAELDEVDDETPRLFTHNADVDRINDEKLASLPARAHSFAMSATGPSVLTDALKRGCLSPETLALKEGAIVMCTKNNPAVGYVNGTLGSVIGYEMGTGYPIIETRDGRELVIAPVDWAVEENGKVRAKLAQVPLRLAWAITVHKSQGMSMDAAAMDLSRAFEYGQGYVALSRVRTLQGLRLLGWSEGAMQVHPDVLRVDRSFREQSEGARRAFEALDASEELVGMQERFIKASGGTVEAVEGNVARAPKKSTYDETLTLIKEGKSLGDIVATRALTFGTICDHLEKLREGGLISPEEIDALLPDTLRTALPKIRAAFGEGEDKKLAPAFGKLKGKYSYDELKLARLVILGEK
ncbi:MAG: AAA family ATPase [Candidatus Pacebacteria bacterium]|nr:AAA family ATPase [Candidatus Paceibacterota bacterium]